MMAVSARLLSAIHRWRTRREREAIARLDRPLAEYLASQERPACDPALERLVAEAWAAGQAIDLTGVPYGPPHWQGSGTFRATALPYYYFLAGFARTQQCRTVVEIGTHFGGSALALRRGGATRIVTIDITDLNPELHRTEGITKLTGDANAESVIKRVFLELAGARPDLLYIDAEHSFLPTLRNLAIYATLFRPRFLLADDIGLNGEMRTLWAVLASAYGADAIDCAVVVPEIRADGVGFGLVRMG